MKTDKGRWFSWESRSYLKRRYVNTDEILFGVYKENGKKGGELEMFWDESRTPRLISFSDTWGYLASFQDLLDVMAEKDSVDIKPIQFVDMLLACGFEDVTEY